jgi:hypothetical protein
VIQRLVVGYVLALPAIAFILTGAVDRARPGVIVTMSSRQPGVLQLFYDSGKGFNAAQSSLVSLQPSDERRQYRLELPPGDYRSLRIDPGTMPGRYVLERVSVRLGVSAADLIIPLDELLPYTDVRVVARSRGRLDVDAVGYDPVLIYTPASTMTVSAGHIEVSGQWQKALGWWLVMVVAVWLTERWVSRLVPGITRLAQLAKARMAARPARTILLVALFSTGIATYPLCVAGRSLVSPNNGGAPMLYAEPPFVPGSTDAQREDTRGSDVWATMLEFVPYSHIQREALSQGEVPLWNRYNGAGRPLWGQGMTFLLDPLHWLTFVSRNPAIGWDLKFVAHRFLFALGVGLAAFAAHAGLLPSVIVAAGAPFLGIYSFWLNHPGTFALTYAPWALLAWFRLACADTWRLRAQAATLISVTMSLVLVASPPKQAIATLLGTVLAGGFALLLLERKSRQKLESVAAAAVAMLVMALLTAPHWLTFVDTLRLAVTEYDVPSAWFADERAAVALFSAPLNPGPVAPGFHLLALVLGLATVTAPRYLWSHRELFGALLGSVVLLATAFGALPASVITRIPFIKNISHFNDIFVAAAMPAFLVAAAAGAGALFGAGAMRTSLVASLTVAIVCWVVTWGTGLAAESAFQPWMVLLLLLPSAALPWCIAGCRRPLGGLAVTVACVVLLFPGGLHLDSGWPELDALLIQPRHRVHLSLDSPAVQAVHQVAASPSRSVGLEQILMPGSQALYQLEGIGGADALEVPAYRQLLDAAGIRRSSWITWLMPSDVERLSPLLDMLNVGFLFVRSETGLPGLADVPVGGEDRLRVVRRTTTWPRAFFVDRLTTYSGPAHLVQKAERWRSPFAAIESVGSADAGPAPADATVIQADSYRLTINTTRFRIRAPGPGVAVLCETYLQGHFLATLNGQRVPYFRVNHAFKALRIPSAGNWQITFEYRPPRWDLSILMAAGGASVLALALALARRAHLVSMLSNRPL